MKEKMKQKIRSVYERVKTGFHSVINRVRDLIANRPEVVVAALGAISMSIRSFFRWRTTKNMKDMRDKSFYDPRRGHYVYTKRKLNGYELEELDRRYKSGESYSKILSDMRLLK